MQQRENRKKLLSPEGTLVSFLTKTGQVIILNIVWLLSCIPVFTIGTATTSLYYAMMKNIRRNRSYPLTEYWASFKRTFVRGSLFTVFFGVWFLLLAYLWMSVGNKTDMGYFLGRVYQMLMLVSAAVLLYLFPVLSRFQLGMTEMVKLSFVMAVRYIGYTVVMLSGTAVLIWAWIYYLPMPTVFFLPGVWCYLCTFMVEKALRRYMPEADENEDAWYYE